MPAFVADLHVHSKYSRACARDLELPQLTWWARRKGITVLGTGDFTHPAWLEHLEATLVPAEPGLYQLNPQLEQSVRQRLPRRLNSAEQPTRFMLSVEISTIYKRDGRTRKVHHLIYLPDLDAVRRFNAKLARIGNLGSDGRPILGLDSRDLLEITLECSPDGYLVPAHIWTPWFSALGSKSGFDAIADCYADLAGYIFAVETGLSSDPEMNWRVSSLDAYRLVSNSDAHSAPALAREATLFDTALDYYAIKAALQTGHGLHGTIEFFPEEGKYHADGHRACGVNWMPEQTKAANGLCPVCARPLTVGVLSRVEELADRAAGARPQSAAEHRVVHLVQLPEILGEVHGVGARSKTVENQLTALVAALGCELDILMHTPLGDIRTVGGELLAEAIGRLRAGRVIRVPGYDGEYGVIRLFTPDELHATSTALFELPQPATTTPEANTAVTATQPLTPVALFELTPPEAAPTRVKPKQTRRPRKPAPEPVGPLDASASEPMLDRLTGLGSDLLDRLDPQQREAASAPDGPMLIVAGPGTGKTRTLTHRIAYLCEHRQVPPDQCLAITFTRRATEELRTRLAALLGPAAEQVTATTFHALGLAILRENAKQAGLMPGFRVADEAERATLRAEAGDDQARYVKLLRAANLVDLDELTTLPATLLAQSPSLVDTYRRRWPWVFVDEYQDVDPPQYELLRLLVPPSGNICAIGDPDQAIYSFRGSDVTIFLRFTEDFPGARLIQLTRNYRSTPPIVAAATQAIAPSTLVPGRRLDPRPSPGAPLIGQYAASSPVDEAEFVARTIDELVGGVSHRSLDSGRVDSRVEAEEISFADIAVLYRTDAQAAAIVEALTRAGIPVQKRSHDRLKDRPGVAAIARELRFATGLGGSLAARLRLTASVLADRQATLAQPGEPSVAGGLTAEDVWFAVDLLTPLTQRCGDDLEQFLAEIATGAEVDALDPRAQAVTLLTLHAAKGLEFPVVFLVGCEDGLLPLRLAGRAPSDAETAEERRLFFVGITRAQRRLYLSHAARRYRYGSERPMSPSPFLAAISPKLLKPLCQAKPRRPRDRQLRLL